MNTLFIASGPLHWASARIRCYWTAAYMHDAHAATFTDVTAEDLDRADAVIFQKTRPLPGLREQGKRVYWDLCDPVYWWNPAESRAALEYVDGVVLSSPGLHRDFSNWAGDAVPSYCIPDRLELAHYPLKRQHREADPVRFIWYGMAQNRVSLFGAIANLERLQANGHHVSLTICDNEPTNEWQISTVPTYYTRWSLERENEIISGHDVALLPPYPGPWGQVKSDNKALTAYACGLPVTDGLNYAEMNVMTHHPARAEVARMRAAALESVEQSAREWEALLCA